MDSVTIQITKALAGQTIKSYLKSMHVGRGKIEEIRVNQSAYIQGKSVSLDTILQENDQLSFHFLEKIDCSPSSAFPLEVLYEDDAICIVNKPAHLLIHDDGETNGDTLCNLVANHYYQKKIYRPIRYIHRLDQETTGIVLFAKDFLSEAKLHADMEEHRIEREYLGIVTNRLKEKSGTIQKPIGRDRHNAKKKARFFSRTNCDYPLSSGKRACKSSISCSISFRNGKNTSNSCSYECYAASFVRGYFVWRKLWTFLACGITFCIHSSFSPINKRIS